MKKVLKKIEISIEDLKNILKEWDADQVEACPLDTLAFCHYIFYHYEKIDETVSKYPNKNCLNYES